MDDPAATPPSWQRRTVERSLKSARERAISRGDQFIAAAVDLLRTNGKPDFTVQEVVDRSGMSLRSFYHHFATKDDLLLAVTEETIRRYIDGIRPAVEAAADPVAKLRVLLSEMFGEDRRTDPASRGIVLFHWHLADTRTEEFAATLAPQVALIIEILEAGIASGVFRTDIPVPALATLVNHTILSILEMRVLGVEVADTPVGVDHLVGYCLGAVSAEAASAAGVTGATPRRKASRSTAPAKRRR